MHNPQPGDIYQAGHCKYLVVQTGPGKLQLIIISTPPTTVDHYYNSFCNRWDDSGLFGQHDQNKFQYIGKLKQITNDQIEPPPKE